MRDCFELNDLLAYLLGVIMVAPLLRWLQHYSSLLSWIVCILAFAFLAIYLVRFRWSFPEQLDTYLMYQACVLFLLGIVTFLTLTAWRLVHWIGWA